MSTHTCPEGHTSTAPDYCDVCGTPIASGATGSATPSAAPAPAAASSGSVLDLGSAGSGDAGAAAVPVAASQACPNCTATNATDALFCEHCGYDFTTGQLPQPLAPPPGRGATAAPLPDSALPERTPSSGAAESEADLADDGADDLADDGADSGADAGPAATETDGPDAVAGTGSDPAADPSPADSAAADAQLQPPPSDPSPAQLPASALTPATVEWVAEIWVDPDWHAAQDIDDPCPSPGMPLIVPLRSRHALIGRSSATRNIHPDIEIGADTGVSRRHAQLTGDGQRWWVEDLQSANGTYVGAAGDPLPQDSIMPGSRVELSDDDRIYIGAWSRLVLRRASAAEQAAAAAGTL